MPDGKELRAGLCEGVAHETTDSSQTGIAGANSVAALLLEVIEKRENVFRRDRGESEPINRTMEADAEKSQQQSEGVAVCGDRLGAELTLCEEVFGEEPL